MKLNALVVRPTAYPLDRLPVCLAILRHTPCNAFVLRHWFLALSVHVSVCVCVPRFNLNNLMFY